MEITNSFYCLEYIYIYIYIYIGYLEDKNKSDLYLENTWEILPLCFLVVNQKHIDVAHYIVEFSNTF